MSIRLRLLLLSGTLMVVLLVSNLWMRHQIGIATTALGEQSVTTMKAKSATDALRTFGEMKYWYADLEVSLLSESETMAKAAAEEMQIQLRRLADVAPDVVPLIERHVKEFVDLSNKAVDAYTDDNRTKGNSHAADARQKMQAVDDRLAGLAKDFTNVSRAIEERSAATMATVGWVSVVVLAGAAALAVVLTWLTLTSIIKPLSSMTRAMTGLAEGSKDVELPTQLGRDEIGAMGRALLTFKELGDRKEEMERRQAEEQTRRQKRQARIEEMIRLFDDEAQRALAAATGAAGGLRATADAMAGVADRIKGQSTAVAAASQQTSANVETVASAAEEMSASLKEIGGQVTRSATVARTAVEDINRADRIVGESAEAAKRIGDVVKLINEIAAQTNLLALNATIEAARAGDAGKGFAVVASEVKSLANQTAKATEEIAVQIQEVQSSTGEVVKAIRGVAATIDDMARIAATISTAVEEQNAATSEIARSVHQAAAGTRDVAERIGEVSSIAGETEASAGQVLGSAGQLTGEIETLRRGVEQFLAGVRTA